MRNYLLSVVGGLLCLGVSLPSQAGTDLSGEWAGSYKAVQVGRPSAPRSPFAPRLEDANDDVPDFIEGSMTVVFEVQQDGIAVMNWTTGQYSERDDWF